MSKSSTIWFDKPAEDWNEALPREEGVVTQAEIIPDKDGEMPERVIQ